MISAILQAKYPRAFIPPTGEAGEKFFRAQECIRAASGRKPSHVKIKAYPASFRTVIMANNISFISVASENDPFLGVFPKNLHSLPSGLNLEERVQLKFDCSPFTDKEFEIMDQAMPYLEPLLGETVFMVSTTSNRVIDWVEGMTKNDEKYYRETIDPYILAEMKELRLSQGDLVCDPACGRGKLIRKIKDAFPGISIVGSDVTQPVVELARIVNRSVTIHVCSAHDLNYLNLGEVSLFIMCGLLNQSVVSRDVGERILQEAIIKSKDYAYMIIAGKSFPMFNRNELVAKGLYPFIFTKWRNHSFYPVYVCLMPRKVRLSENQVRVIPVI